MLLPQFSIRTMLALTAIAAVVSLVLQQATVGATWAYAVCATFAYLIFLFATFASFFLLCFLVGRVLGIAQGVVRSGGGGASAVALESPFAAGSFATEAVLATSSTASEPVADSTAPTKERPE